MIVRFGQTIALAFVFWAIVPPSFAFAGPPFVTDDPEPTDYQHWEIYAGITYENDGDGSTSASVPFAEFNFGALPNVQVSASAAKDDTEFGIKTRFVQESSTSPQISFYPSVEFASVSGMHAVTFLPLWMQKSWGDWTAFGGGGEYLNDSPGMRNSTFAGGALERVLSPGLTVGVELYHNSNDLLDGDDDSTATNLGMIAPVGKYHAILFSVGRALHGPATFTGYASYEFALGPER